MNLQEIKSAIEEGKNVYWDSLAYKVVKDSLGQYLIQCGKHCIGLYWEDGDVTKLNGKESEFFIGE